MRFFLIASLLFLSACSGLTSNSPQPSAKVIRGETLLFNPFDDPTSWETFGMGNVLFGISEGRYTAVATGGGYVWGLNDVMHSDVVIEVKAQYASDDMNGIYGVGCRVYSGEDNYGVGYYFLITADGRYTIRQNVGGEFEPLVPFEYSPVINQGQSLNTIRAECVKDYLALYVNDQFLADVRRDWLQTGVAAMAVNTSADNLVAVLYDDLTIWSASLDE